MMANDVRIHSVEKDEASPDSIILRIKTTGSNPDAVLELLINIQTIDLPVGKEDGYIAFGVKRWRAK
jgi:hypothetical protein